MTDSIRVNKLLAERLGVSRREADELIQQGRVSLHGDKVLLGMRTLATSPLAVDGSILTAKTQYTYIALNKPAGYVCSRKRQGDTPTIYELLPEKYRSLKTVGRLDKDSSGIILLTDDGNFTHRMTHPKFHKRKVYEVTLDHALQPLHRQMISDFGVMLEDGKSKFELSRPDNSDNDKEWIIAMTEGRNRQIRRTFAALGYSVTALHRTLLSIYSTETMRRGEHILLDVNK